MANRIGNKILIEAIDDGVHVSATLEVNGTLNQQYSEAGVAPDWSGGGPTLTVKCYKNGTATVPQSGYHWYYNGTEITFSSNGLSTAVGILGAGTFKKAESSGVPSLQIMKNLAGNGNTDDDLIEFAGSIDNGSNPLSFRLHSTVTISPLSSSGLTASLSATPGSVSGRDGGVSTATVTASLYEGTTLVDPKDYTCTWYVNGEAVSSSSTDPKVVARSGSSAHQLTITHAAITDYAVIRCEMNKNGNKAFASVGIDDEGDEQLMQIYYKVSSAANDHIAGTSLATSSYDSHDSKLHANEHVSYGVYVTGAGGGVLSAYKNFYLLVRDAGGTRLDNTNTPIQKASGTNATYNSGTGLFDIGGGKLTIDGSAYNLGRFYTNFEKVKAAGGRLSIEVYAETD